MSSFRLPRVLPFAALLLSACGETPPPATPPSPTPTVVIPPAPPAPTASASGTASAAPAALDPEAYVRLFPVARIYSLIDVSAVDGSVVARVGYDPGGGMIGRYRYVPLTGGMPDWAQETDEVMYANTASDASVEIAGKWPDLVRRATAGFRSSASDYYWKLNSDLEWTHLQADSRSGVGVGILAWSDGRLLEWRKNYVMATGPDDPDYWLPEVRVLRGAKKDAPSLPAALEKRLKKAGFVTASVTAFRTGEVLAVGTLSEATNKLGTVLWKDKPKDPEYVVSTVAIADGAELAPELLGGDSLASVRLLCGSDRVMKLDGATWVEESKVTVPGQPDVWFGKTLVRETDKGVIARMAAGAAWMPVALAMPEGLTPLPTGEAYPTVDAEGVIWGVLSETLVSSKPPAGDMAEVTEEDIVKRRKASVLRGGSMDVTGQEPGPYVQTTCSTHYVELDQRPVSAAADTTDYPEVRKKLRGFSELAKMKLVVSREKGIQLFGAETSDEGVVTKLSQHLTKGSKKVVVRSMCATPAVVREIKVDAATGDVVK